MDRLEKWIQEEQNAVVPDIVLRKSEATFRKISEGRQRAVSGPGTDADAEAVIGPGTNAKAGSRPLSSRKGRRFRFWLVTAAASVLIMGVIVAAAVRSGWIVGFMGQEKGPLTEEEIQDVEALVTEVNEQEETSFASVRMTEAYYDGKSAILHFQILPFEGQGLMLIPGGYSVYDDRGLLMGKEKEGITMLEIFQEEESPYSMVCGVYPRKVEILPEEGQEGLEDDQALQHVDFLLQEDGSLEAIYYLRFWTFEAQRNLGCQFSVKPYREPLEDDETEPALAELVSFPVTLKQAEEESPVLTWTGAEEYPEAGIRLDAVTIRETPIELQYEIHYTVTDPDLYASQDYLFEWVSSDDTEDASVRLQPGLTGQFARTLSRPGADGSAVIEVGSLALSEKRDVYLVRLFSIDTRIRGEAVEITPQ